MTTGIDQLILNSPFAEPKEYWHFDRDAGFFVRERGRRPAGYVVASERSKAFDDPGVFVEIPLVNQVRPRVKAWREAGYPGATGITQRLLKHWREPEEQDENRRFFFCQLEAIETLIWMAEAPQAERVGIDIPSDGGAFQRLCSKMATGSGKTVVMAMLIAWHVLNKVTYPQDSRYSKNVFVVAPGLTVRSRLRVLIPGSVGNYYEQFRIIPSGLGDKLRQGRVTVTNWQALAWDSAERLTKRRSVDKRGQKSDEAYAREVLGDMTSARNIVVINDEAHHAWRVPAESKVKGLKKEDIEEATVWVGGLDRIQAARGILVCYDFSATPFTPTGKKTAEEALFGWIVSDFGLSDAIESGLVKTPRVVVRDNGRLASDYKARFYHLYNDPEVKDDLNRKAEEQEPLPDLVTQGYYFLGLDWRETANDWHRHQMPTPPVIITVANRTETAARVKYAFDHGRILIPELGDAKRTLHIDSKVLEMAEAETQAQPDGATQAATPSEDGEDGSDVNGEVEPAERKLTKKERAELLRHMVDTVGRVGEPGRDVQNVISVGMLSEGWDAKTVTHIMGLRAFSSQLLCEQVVGRGLRRTSYELNPKTGLFDAEYVNIFGVPFTFLPHEDTKGTLPKPPTAKLPVEPVANKKQYEITWPNLIRIEHTFRPRLTLDLDKLEPLELDAYNTPTLAELAPIIGGRPDVRNISTIDLERLAREFRYQKIVFEVARDVFDQMKPTWPSSKQNLLAQLIRLIEQYVQSDTIRITPPLFFQDDLRRRILITLNMTKVVQHVWNAIRYENTATITPVFDVDRPILSTGDMATWYTGKPNQITDKSHINRCVYDSTWEASEAYELERNGNVKAWVKNDHLGFEILYVYQGVLRKYRPDFLIWLNNGDYLVLEVKGQDTQQDRTKREYLDEWVRAVNAHSGFGRWTWAVSTNPADLAGVLVKAVGRKDDY